MDKPKGNLDFRLMSLFFKIRDAFLTPERVLREAGIESGFHVLDYGCGPGGYSIAAAEIAGDAGKVYALDIHPLAVKRVRDIAGKKGLGNIETIRSDRETNLPDESMDVVILYDILHDLSDPDGVLKELHRVLKTDGIISFSDHHMKEDETISRMTSGGFFRLAEKGIGKKRTYCFSKA